MNTKTSVAIKKYAMNFIKDTDVHNRIAWSGLALQQCAYIDNNISDWDVFFHNVLIHDFNYKKGLMQMFEW